MVSLEPKTNAIVGYGDHSVLSTHNGETALGTPIPLFPHTRFFHTPEEQSLIQTVSVPSLMGWEGTVALCQ